VGQVIPGKAGSLKNPIYHDDQKPFDRWLSAKKKYSDQEAEKLYLKKRNCLKVVDKIRKLVFFMPILIPIYILFFKGDMMKGKRGLYYVH